MYGEENMATVQLTEETVNAACEILEKAFTAGAANSTGDYSALGYLYKVLEVLGLYEES